MEERVRAAGSGQVYPVSPADRRVESQERSFAELIKGAIGNVQEIVRSEFRLARTEVREEVKQAGRSAGMFAAAGLLGFFALGFVLFGLMLVLALFAPAWLASLIVGFVLAIGAGILLAIGRERWNRVHPVPEKTVDSLKENVEWLRNQTR